MGVEGRVARWFAYRPVSDWDRLQQTDEPLDNIIGRILPAVDSSETVEAPTVVAPAEQTSAEGQSQPKHSLLYRAKERTVRIARAAAAAPSKVVKTGLWVKDATKRIASTAGHATADAGAGLARRTWRYTRWGLIAVGATVTAGLYGLIGPLPQTLDSKRDSFRASCVNSVVETLTDTAYDSWKESVKGTPPPAQNPVVKEASEMGDDVKNSFAAQADSTYTRLNVDLETDARFSENLSQDADRFLKDLYERHGRPLVEGSQTKTSPAVDLLGRSLERTVPPLFLSDIKNRDGFNQKLDDILYNAAKPHIVFGLKTMNDAADTETLGHFLMPPLYNAGVDAYLEAGNDAELRAPVVDFLADLEAKWWESDIEKKNVECTEFGSKMAQAGLQTLSLAHEAAAKTLQAKKGQIMYADDVLYIFNQGDYIEFNLTKTGTQRRMNDILALAEYTKAQVQNAGVRVDPKEIRASSGATMEVDVLFFQKWGSRIFAAIGGFLGTVLDPSYTIPLDSEFRRLNEPDYRFATRSADRCVEEAMLEIATPGTDRQLSNALLDYAERRYRSAAMDIEQRHADCTNCKEPTYAKEGCVALGFNSNDMELPAPNPKLADLLRRNATFSSSKTLEDIVPLRKDDDDARSYEKNRLLYIEHKIRYGK